MEHSGVFVGCIAFVYNFKVQKCYLKDAVAPLKQWDNVQSGLVCL